MTARRDCWNQFGSIRTSHRPWNGLCAVPVGLLNFNFAFVKFTCALKVPCRCPEWRSGGEVEGKWLHLRGEYALDRSAELFRGTAESQETILRMVSPPQLAAIGNGSMPSSRQITIAH